MSIDDKILNCIEVDWKSVPEIAKVLEESVVHVNKRINQLQKYDLVLSMYGKKELHKRGKISKIFKKKEVIE